MRIEISDNYVLVDGIFYYREQGDTCAESESTLYDENYDGYEHALSCGHIVMTYEEEPPNYCSECGVRVKH